MIELFRVNNYLLFISLQIYYKLFAIEIVLLSAYNLHIFTNLLQEVINGYKRRSLAETEKRSASNLAAKMIEDYVKEHTK